MDRIRKGEVAIEAANREIAKAHKAIAIVVDAFGVAMTATEVEDLRQRREMGIKLS